MIYFNTLICQISSKSKEDGRKSVETEVTQLSIAIYPALNREASLPTYISGVGIGIDMLTSTHLPMSSLQLIITVKGGGTVAVGEEKFLLTEGCGIYLGSGVEYRTSAAGDDSWTVDRLTFDFSSDELKKQLFTKDSYAFFTFKRPAMISEDIRKIAETVSRDSDYGGFFASAILYSMLIELNFEKLSLPDGNEKRNSAVVAAINYISTHYTENLSLEELCKVAGGLSEQYFCRLFKQHTGMRPIEYILRKRINVAKSYLEKTDLPISDIARMTGFNNASYFYRNFKKFTGISPLACRQSALNLDSLAYENIDT